MNLNPLKIAFSTYSILPMPQADWNRQNIRSAIAYMPLVGCVSGFLLWGWHRLDVYKRQILVFAADNGVQTEGVSITPRNVTMLQAVNMTHYKTGMGALAKHFGQKVHVVDMGIYDPYECAAIQNLSLIHI